MTMTSTRDNAFTATTPYGLRGEATYAGALSFLRRPYARDLADADVAVTGIPFDLATTNRPGARLGPRAVRAASAQLPGDRRGRGGSTRRSALPSSTRETAPWTTAGPPTSRPASNATRRTSSTPARRCSASEAITS